MKKIFPIAVMLMFSIVMYAQEDVTRFLGIPLDGTKSEMIQKLNKKGFHYNAPLGCLTGEFNGEDVTIFVVTDNDKVWRIAVFDDLYRDKRQITYRFNNLFEQFYDNGKYLLYSGSRISDDDDINWDIVMDKKQYEASFVQYSTNIGQRLEDLFSFESNQMNFGYIDELDVSDSTKQILTETFEKMAEAQKLPLIKAQTAIDSLVWNRQLSYDNITTVSMSYLSSLIRSFVEKLTATDAAALRDKHENIPDADIQKLETSLKTLVDAQLKNTRKNMLDYLSGFNPPQNLVWFEIDRRSAAEYRIIMFYDNKRNKAQGEDL